MNKSFKYLIVILVILAILFVTISLTSQEDGNSSIMSKNSSIELNTSSTIEDALTKAKSENKTVLVVFKNENCFYCVKLKEETLNNEKVINKLNENYITTFVDINEKPELASKYNVFATPVMLFLDSNGNTINRLEGFYNSDELLKILEEE